MGRSWEWEEGGERKEERGGDTPDSCLHPPDMKSWLKHCCRDFLLMMAMTVVNIINASAVTLARKVQLTLIGSPLRALQ